MNKTFFTFAAAMLFFALNFVAVAQDTEVNDPLKKPDVWEKLKKSPADAKLWEAYTGKKWEAMSKSEQERVAIWRQELMLRGIMEHEIVITSEEKMVAEDERAIDEIKSSELKNAEMLIMQEQEEITELKTNISENFVILEDLYKDLFAEYGLEYKTYASTHPDGKFPLTRWIHEHDEKIKAVKKAKVDELRKQIKSGK
jgi:hypothetical protein